MMVLLDLFLVGFSKFQLFTFKNRDFVGLFGVLHKILFLRWLSQRGNDFITDWVNEERIITSPESTPNEFSRSQRSKCWEFLHRHPNSRSASAERIFSLTESTKNKFYRWVSQRGTNFIADWVNAVRILSLTKSTKNKFYRWMSQRGTNFIADWVNAVRILSLTKSTKNKFYRWMSQRRTNFITGRAHGEIKFINFPDTIFTGLAQNSYCISQLLWVRNQASLRSLLRPPAIFSS